MGTKLGSSKKEWNDIKHGYNYTYYMVKIINWITLGNVILDNLTL